MKRLGQIVLYRFTINDNGYCYQSDQGDCFCFRFYRVNLAYCKIRAIIDPTTY
ncbi:hypothetical protein [Rossellomorea sp. BNER]|uniref:hypothetical protein n=1 Tax=Rossellomorea sp. BNER TaxID=2962031 RepID=UPI003AF2DBBF|nr:hypothetical protein [Rossellomorea sp. BNER]